MFQNLLKQVGYGELANYQVEEEKSYSTGIWDAYKGVTKSDKSPVTVFASQPGDDSFLTNNAQQMKSMRHPYILKCFEFLQAAKGGSFGNTHAGQAPHSLLVPWCVSWCVSISASFAGVSDGIWLRRKL